MKARELVKLLVDNGWKLEKIEGSHHIYKKGKIRIPVPIHGKNIDLRIGTLNDILKRAGLK